MSTSNMSVRIDAESMRQVQDMLMLLGSDEVPKAQARGINKTMTGVRTDGVKMMTERYALTASEIRDSWKINTCKISDPSGDVSTKGVPIRLMKFGAKQVSTGVSVKVLKTEGRKIVKGAFIGKINKGQNEDQVYIRQWKFDNPGGSSNAGTGQMNMKGYIWSKKYNRYIPAKWMEQFQNTGEFKYRFPVKALYGPRIQNIFDTEKFKILMDMAEVRLFKNIDHEVNYLLGLEKL